MKKTINKWDVTTKKQQTVIKVAKIIMTIVFLSLWLPIMFHVVTEIFK